MKLPDLGPLPKTDAASALERESLDELRHALVNSHMLIRDERIMDYGVDASLEVIVEGAATNFRAQVQLKGRSNLVENADGSISVGDIETPNLNYLLSGPTPLYILYRPEQKELRYVFARDEEHRLASLDSKWRSQKTTTIRFVDRLDAAGIEIIRNRIANEAYLVRKMSEVVFSPSAGPTTHISVSTKQQTVDSQSSAKARILRDGMRCVSEGKGAEIIEWFKLLRPEDCDEQPLILLTVGYAHFYAGSYAFAEPHLRGALACDMPLDAENQKFLSYLVSSVEFATGRIDKGEYLARFHLWRTDVAPTLAIQYDLLKISLSHASATSDSAWANVLSEL